MSIETSLEKYYRDELGLPDWKEHVRLRLITEQQGYGDLIRKLGIISGKKVLSVGSGWGGFAIAASKAGADSYGIEPDAERCTISITEAEKRGWRCRFICNIGEKILFEDNTFDIIDCTSVLEHVQDPRKVVAEMVRILKPGGICHIDAPNYLYPAEAHYKIFWIPMMPKSLAVIYLKFIKRNPEFIMHINYITPLMLRRILAKINNIIVMEIGEKPIQDTRAATTTTSRIKRHIWNMWAELLGVFNIEKTNELIIYKKVVEDVPD